MAQVTSVVSEPLQAKIRSLLPSQAGFTEDLQAQNVIVPIIDLTETASGSVLRQDLQTSLAFGSQTSFNQSAAGTSTIINSTGFFQITGFLSIVRSTGSASVTFELNDGATTKDFYKAQINGGSETTTISENINFIVFLRSGDSCSVTTNSGGVFVAGSTRQIADLQGNLVNPSGFTSE